MRNFIRLSTAILTVFIFSTASQAQRFWVPGGTGDWSSTTNWSATSGGASGASVPVATDDVFFNANSFPATQTVTVSTAVTCLNMDWTGVLNNPTFAFAAGGSLTVRGSVTLANAMSVTSVAGSSLIFTNNATTFNTGNPSATKNYPDINYTGTGAGAKSFTVNATNTAGTHNFRSLAVAASTTFAVNGTSVKNFTGVTFNSPVIATMNGTTTAFGGLTLTGTGANTLGGTGDYSFGGVNSIVMPATATLLINNTGTNSFGDLNTGGAITIANTGNNNFGSDIYSNGNVTVSNTGSNNVSVRIRAGSTNAVTFSNTAANTFSFVDVQAGTLTINNTGFDNIFSGSITNAGTFTISNTVQDNNFSSITNTGTLNINNSRDNTFSGSLSGSSLITVNNGRNNSFGVITVSTPLTVTNLAKNQTFTGSFTVAANTTFNNTGTNTFNAGTTLTVNTAASASFANGGTNTFNNVTLNRASTWVLASNQSNLVGGLLTVSTICPATATDFATITASAPPTRANFNFTGTGNFTPASNVSIANINKAGALLTITGGTDGGNNNNITVNNLTTARTLFWVGGTGNWNDCNRWAVASGGPGGFNAPTVLDNVIFDNNSFTAAGQTVTVTAGATARNMTWATATNNPTFNLANPVTFTGDNVTFANAMVIAGTATITLDESQKVAATDPVTFNAGAIAAGTRTFGPVNFTSVATRTINFQTGNAGTYVFTNGTSAGLTVAGPSSGISTFNLTGTSAKTFRAISFGASITSIFDGSTTVSNNGATFGASNNTTFNNNFTLSSNQTLSFGNNSTALFSGTASISRDMTFGNSCVATFTGNVTVNRNTLFGTGATATYNGSTNIFTGTVSYGTGATVTHNNSTFNNAVTVGGTSGSTFNNSTFQGASPVISNLNGTYILSTVNFTGTGTTNFTGAVSAAALTGSASGITNFLGNFNNTFNGVTLSSSHLMSLQNTGTNNFTAGAVSVSAATLLLRNTGNNSFTNATVSGFGFLDFSQQVSGTNTISGTLTLQSSARFLLPPVAAITTTVGTLINSNPPTCTTTPLTAYVLIDVANRTTAPAPSAAIRGRLSITGGFTNPANIWINNIDYLGTSPATPLLIENSQLSAVNNNNITTRTIGTASRTLYWRGGTGNWNSQTNWFPSPTSTVAVCPPTEIDDTFFDGLSFTAAGQIVTVTNTAINNTVPASIPAASDRCRNITWTGATNNPQLSLANNAILNIHGVTTLNPVMTVTNATGGGYLNFTTAVNDVAVRAITTAGVNLPEVLFTGVNNTTTASWQLSDNLTVARQIGLQGGTLDFNGFNVSARNFTANIGNVTRKLLFNSAATPAARATQMTILGNRNYTSSFGSVMDWRGSNFSVGLPVEIKLGTQITFTAPTPLTVSGTYLDFFTGDNGTATRDIPDLVFTAPSDIDVTTPNYNGNSASPNRIVFRNIDVQNTTNSAAQFYVAGTSPKTYGNINIAPNLIGTTSIFNPVFGPPNLNTNRFEGCNNTAQPNIFNGTVNIGNNSRMAFYGTNVFNRTFTSLANNQLYFANANTFNDVTSMAADNAGGSIVFGLNTSETTTFNANTTLTSPGNPNATYSVYGGITQATGTTLVIDQGVTVNSFGSVAYNLNGTLEARSASITTFQNSLNNTYNNITLVGTADLRFSSEQLTGGAPGTKVTNSINGTISSVVNCLTLSTFRSASDGLRAILNLNGTKTLNSSIVKDIEVVAGVLNVNSGSNAGNNLTLGTSINFTAGSGGTTLYWVGGNPTRLNNRLSAGIAVNNNWNNPDNWVQISNILTDDPTFAQLSAPGVCIPDAVTNVVFGKESFRTASLGGKNSYEVNLNVDASCRIMLWRNDADQNANTGTAIPSLVCNNPAPSQNGGDITMRVFNDLTFLGNNRMLNTFGGVFELTRPDALVSLLDFNGTGTIPTPFTGQVRFSQVGATFRLQSDMVVTGAITQNGNNGGRRSRGDIIITPGATVIANSTTGQSANITLDDDWIVLPANPGQPEAIFTPGATTRITFNGPNANASTQRIAVGGANVATGFPNFTVLREVTNASGLAGAVDVEDNPNQNQNQNVVVTNAHMAGFNSASFDSFTGVNISVSAGDPETNYGSDPSNNTLTSLNTGRQFFNADQNGLTITNNLEITRGALWDFGYQIKGASAATMALRDGAALHIGSNRAESGVNSNNPVTTIFPTAFTRSNITIENTVNGSTVVYRARGHQDISAEPTAYSNLFLFNPTPVNGLNGIVSNSTRKRLSLATAAKPLTLNRTLTIQPGIIFFDMGQQIGVGASANLALQNGGTLMLGSGNQTIATTTGSGYNPVANTTGTTILPATATAFPTFPDANLNIDQNSNVVYASSLAQTVRGNLNVIVASGRRYGNLITFNPTITSPVLSPKTIQGGTVLVNNLITHPNTNLVDNGFQINGTTGSFFAMNFRTDPLGLPFNGQAPTSTATASGANPFTVSGTNPVNAARNDNWGLKYEGFIRIPAAGTYTFYTTSDDGSLLSINGNIVVNNNFQQPATTRSGTITFLPGTYPQLLPLTVTFHQGNGGLALSVEWESATVPIARQQIPNTVLSTSSSSVTGSITRNYYEAPAGVNFDVNNPANPSSAGLPVKWYPDFGVQSTVQNVSVSGESRLVLGTAVTATLIPTNYGQGTDDYQLDANTTIIYNAGVDQTVAPLGISSSTANNRMYGNLVLTNANTAATNIVTKFTTSASEFNELRIRNSLIINPRNNFYTDAVRVRMVNDGLFRMNSTTQAFNPVTEPFPVAANLAPTGTLVGPTGESRFTTSTQFVLGLPSRYARRYLESSTTPANSTTVDYNRFDLVSRQLIAVFDSPLAQQTENYANLHFTNTGTGLTGKESDATEAALSPARTAIRVRNDLIINPNVVFGDFGFQMKGPFASGSGGFIMRNTTTPSNPSNGTTVGAAGESRFIIMENATAATTFPYSAVSGGPGTGYRIGDGSAGDPSDINIETGTTIVYGTTNTTTQDVVALRGTGITTYANLRLNNSGSVTSIKNLVTNLTGAGTLIRGYLDIYSRTNFVDNGLQITGTANQVFTMRQSGVNVPANFTTGTVTLTDGGSTLTLGTGTVATTFPGNYQTINDAVAPTDINFETSTTVVYNSGIDQPVQAIINFTGRNTNANYANLTLTRGGGSGTPRKTIINGDVSIRQTLSIQANNILDVDATNQYNIYIRGDWNCSTGATGGQFVARNGLYNSNANSTTLANYRASRSTVIFEGNTADVQTNVSTPQSTDPNQDFRHIVVSKSNTSQSVNILTAAMAVMGTADFRTGYIQNGAAINPVTGLPASTNLLIFRDGSTAVNASSSSYVRSTAIRKVGRETSNGTFTFPTGTPTGFAQTLYRPIAISDPGITTSSFVTQYFPQNPTGSGFNSTLIDNTAPPAPPLTNVSRLEFWRLEREVSSANVFVTLSWSTAISDVAPTAADRLKLRVARWGGTNWRNLGGNPVADAGATGTVTSQFNVAGTAGAVDAFSPFTLASIDPINPLPVTLLSFTAKPIGQQVELRWKTASEINLKSYVVERSLDATNFQPVGTMDPKGSSEYLTYDRQPLPGTSYYRLKTIDLDGNVSYSKVVSVKFEGNDEVVTLYPNPNEGRIIQISNTNYKLKRVVDMVGRDVFFSDKMQTVNSSQIWEVTFNPQLAAGMYIAILERADGLEVKKIRFVVQ
jgi:hypothetical protein